MKNKNKPKMEFSKQIFIGVTFVAMLVVFFSMYMVWVTRELTPLSYLISAVFVEVATATGFYYHKAKEENKIKLLQIYKDLDLGEYKESNTDDFNNDYGGRI